MFWTQFAGAFNDNYFKNALGILIVYQWQTGVFGLDAKLFVPMSAAVFILPFFLFSATAGQLADKYEKSRLIRVIKVAEIVIMAVGVVGFLTQQAELLLFVLFLMGSQSAFFGPVKYGILPQLLDRDRLVGGNAMVELATYLAILGGTIAGGLLVTQTWGTTPVGVYVVCGGVLAIGVLGFGVSTQVVDCPAENPDLKVKWDPIRPTWEIVKITAKSKPVFLSVLGITWFWSFGTAFLSLFPTYTKDLLGANEAIATLFLAAFSMGIAAGSIICERLSKHRLELGLVPIGAAGMTLFCADLFLIGQPWQLTPELLTFGEFFARPMAWRIQIDLFLIALFGGMYIVPLYTMIQLRAEHGEVSRVIAGNNIINSLAMVLMSLALMALQGWEWTEPQIFGMLAVLNAVCALVVFWQVPEFLLRFAVWMLSNIVYRIEVEGQENIPEEGGCVVIANHVSFIDWFILGGAIKRPVHFVMDVAFAHLPGLKWFAAHGWVIPIASPKRDEVAYEQAFVSIRKKLREGWLVGIFPEGMIAEDGQMNEFRRGIERIVERDSVPIVPIAINGLWGSWFSRRGGPAMQKRPRRFWSRVHITIGEPVSSEGLSAEAMQALVAALYARQPELR
jgi:1-acyl-sn-glycerol-3-phosphate acyltransferase